MKEKQILMLLESREFTVRKSLFRLIICALVVSALAPCGWGMGSKTEAEEAEIVLSRKDSVHDFDNPYDLHNLSTSLLGIMEVEVLRVGDYLIDLPRRGPDIRFFDQAADRVQEAYRLIPQVKPVSRFGQLVDALQIRQLNLSDLRMVPAVVTPGSLRPSPNMQTRLFKLLQFLQDVLNDLDHLIMVPANYAASRVSHRHVRVKTIGFAADGVGEIRKGTFIVLRTVSKRMVETASDGIDWVEKEIGKIKWHGTNKKAETWITYFKMPASFYENEREFFDRHAPEIYVGSLEEWRSQLISQRRAVETLLHHVKRGWHPYSDVASADEVLVATRLKYLKKAPDVIRDYIIDSDEFDALVYEKSSPRAHLKIAPASV